MNNIEEPERIIEAYKLCNELGISFTITYSETIGRWFFGTSSPAISERFETENINFDNGIDELIDFLKSQQ